MAASELLRFLAVSVVVIVTPGPDTALTIRSTLAGGRRAGIAIAWGVATGQAFWTLAASAGITALLSASAPAFSALRMVGALYLMWLGSRALWTAWRGAPLPPAEAPAQCALGLGSAFAQGLLSNLGNPKMVAFFGSLLPQFIAPGEASFAPFLSLGLCFCVMTLAWLCLYAVAIPRIGDVLRRSAVRRALDALLGAVLVMFGLRLATERR